jgi:hypothetical protein
MVSLLLEMGLTNFLPGLASNHNLPMSTFHIAGMADMYYHALSLLISEKHCSRTVILKIDYTFESPRELLKNMMSGAGP